MRIISETQDTAAGAVNKTIRLIFSTLDSVCFWLLGIMYQLFFNVATADLFNSEIILDFYKRFQLIIGVFMIFQLALLILRGIMEPDQITDKKSGAGTFIKRVIISLTLLTVLTPISIPNPENDYERQLNNNGLLFGTLYSLQERILENNTLGRLILGTNNAYSSEDAVVSTTGIESEDKSSQDLKQASDIFASTVLKGFVRINLHPKWEEYYEDNGKQPETQNDCRMCKNISDDALNEYKKLDSDPGIILDYVSEETCKPDNLDTTKNNKNRFAFTYRPLIAGGVAIFFAVILLSFSVDVVIRGVKLVILRLLAPIPIISYMDPKGAKDSAFNSWTKLLVSTYLDLFIRISIVYFALALIQDMIKKGIGMNTGDGLIAVLSYVIIFLGVFAFAKEAPKFIREMLGMKGDGGKLFGGLKAAMGVAGRTAAIGAAGVGAVGAFRAAQRASRDSDETRKSFGETINPESVVNRGKHLLAGMAGGALGLGTGIKTAVTAKDHAMKNTFEAMQKRNTNAINKGNSGSTFLGRASAVKSRLLTGDGPGAELSRKIKSQKSQLAALKQVKGRMSDEMVKKDWTTGSIGNGVRDVNGNVILGRDGQTARVNFKDFNAKYSSAKAQNLAEFQIVDSYGDAHTISLETAEKQQGWIRKENEDCYIRNAVNTTITLDNGTVVTTGVHDDKLKGYIEDAVAKGWTVTDRKSVTSEGIDKLEIKIAEDERQNVINEANDREIK